MTNESNKNNEHQHSTGIEFGSPQHDYIIKRIQLLMTEICRLSVPICFDPMASLVAATISTLIRIFAEQDEEQGIKVAKEFAQLILDFNIKQGYYTRKSPENASENPQDSTQV